MTGAQTEPRLTGIGSVTLEPGCLGVETRYAHTPAATPGTRNRAHGTAEMGDHLAAAATGHTLPRPVGRLRLTRLGLIRAVAIVARHEARRLAFRV